MSRAVVFGIANALGWIYTSVAIRSAEMIELTGSEYMDALYATEVAFQAS